MNWHRNLVVLSLAMLLSSSSYTMLVPFLPLYILDLGADENDINLWSGLIFSVTFLVAAVMAPYWGRNADKTGKRRMVLRAGFSLSAVYFLGAFVHSPIELLGMRILQGFANGFVPASMAIVASTTPRYQLGFSLGFIQTALVMGGILGPLFGGVFSHFFGMRSSFVIAAGVIFLGTLLVRMFVEEPPLQSSRTNDSGGIFDDLKAALHNRKLVHMLSLLFAVQAGSLMLQSFLALYIAQFRGLFGDVALTAGIVCSLTGIAGAIAAPLWGRVGQRRGFMRTLVIAFFGAGIFTLGQFWTRDIYSFSVLQFLMGLFIVGVFPSINAIAINSTDPGFQGRIFGLTTTANQLGSMVGPLVGGIVSSWCGIRPLFFLAGSLFVLLGTAVRLYYFPRPVAEAEKSSTKTKNL